MFIIFLPLLAFALIVVYLRPFPLRVDAVDPKERFGQHCRRISFFLLVIPFVVILTVAFLLALRIAGDGPGLLAYTNFLSPAGRVWVISAIAGVVFGIAGSFPFKKQSSGYPLIAAHVVLLFLVKLAPMMQYVGHPD